jgi:integrase
MGDKQGGVRIASASSLEIDFYYRGVRCRERIRLKPTPPNIKYCAKLKARIEHEITAGQFEYAKHFPDSPRAKTFSKRLPGDALTVGEYLETWLKEEEKNVKHSTHLGYSKIIKYHLTPTFGNLALTELRKKHLYEWMTSPTSSAVDLSAKRIRNIVSVLRIAFDAALEQELIAEGNPLVGFKVRRRTTAGSSADVVDPFSVEERAAILSKIPQGQERNLVLFAFWTGLRTSELVALDWTDIDWLRGEIVISRVLTQGMEEPEEGTKTDAGRRQVKLLPPALEALKAQKVHTFLQGAEVFQNPRTGERWTGDKCIRQGMWTPALRRAGVRYRKPYQTRHTYASMMLMAGENVMWVAQQMGHTDWSLTAKRYSRWIPSDMPDAGSKAVQAFWSAFGQHDNVTYSN